MKRRQAVERSSEETTRSLCRASGAAPDQQRTPSFGVRWFRPLSPPPWAGLGLGQWHILGVEVVDLAAGGRVVGEELKVVFLLKMF